MRAIGKFGSLAMAAALSLAVAGAPLMGQTAAPAAGQDANAGASKQPYTMAEYNAYQAAAAEKDPATKIKLLDDFVSKYPNSELLKYVYPLYYQAYFAQKNYPRVIEYADKTVALGDKLDVTAKYNAQYAHVAAYNALISDPANANTMAKDAALAKSGQAAADAALKTLGAMQKPEGVTDDAFNTQKKTLQIFLYGIAATAAMVQKDYPDAITDYKADLDLKPDDPIVEYNLGKAELATTPPQTLDGFWSIARGAGSKTATAQQSNSLKTYLRKLVVNYQGGTVCDSLTDAQLNELLQLASGAPTRPDSYKLPSAADLSAAQKDMTIASVIADLKAGGDKGKVTWLAACGLEFPDVPGKIIEVTPGADLTEIKVAFVTTEAEFDAATTPNMDVKIVGQPDAARVEKDNSVRFTATLTSYDPDPAFMLHWEKGKVNEEDIPKEKGKKPVRKTPAKKPS